MSDIRIDYWVYGGGMLALLLAVFFLNWKHKKKKDPNNSCSGHV